MSEISDCISCKRIFECKYRGVVHGCVSFEPDADMEWLKEMEQQVNYGCMGMERCK